MSQASVSQPSLAGLCLAAQQQTSGAAAQQTPQGLGAQAKSNAEVQSSAETLSAPASPWSQAQKHSSGHMQNSVASAEYQESPGITC